jgi:uncharacterized protein YkwD
MPRRAPFLLIVLAPTLAALAQPAADPGALLRRAAAERKRLAAPLAFLDDAETRDRLGTLFDERDKLAGEARAWIFDQQRYPTPPKAYLGWVPGQDEQPGHDEMERRVARAIVKHNELVDALAKALRAKPEVAGLKEPTRRDWDGTRVVPKVCRYGIATADGAFQSLIGRLEAVAPEYAKAHAALAAAGVADTEATAEAPLVAALLHLGAGRYEEARAAGGAISGIEGRLFAEACAWRVLAWNRENANGHTEPEAKGVRLLNAFRIAAGLVPLAHHPRVQAMARDHSEEMKRLGFMGHEHPYDPTRRTMDHRARRVGYATVLGENCSAWGGDPSESVIRWRADAAHHRVQMTPDAREVGLGCADRGTLNVGRSKGDLAITRLFEEKRY